MFLNYFLTSSFTEYYIIPINLYIYIIMINSHLEYILNRQAGHLCIIFLNNFVLIKHSYL